MVNLILLWTGGILAVLSLAGFGFRSALGSETASHLRKEQRSRIRKRKTILAWSSVLLLILGIVLSGIGGIRYNTGRFDVEKLPHEAAIEVTNDKDYGAGHTDNPVKYEMAIPTSGTHSPHDLKYGFYTAKPGYELLVHNLEHGDIILYYRPDAAPELTDKLKELVRYRKAGSGILAVPTQDLPAGKDIVAAAWTKTMELPAYDEAKLGSFINRFINHGPETISPEVRQGGGTM
ncbi:DUF3105 domain-containing protein [Gorillibacterium sp. sgz5001074]|uniref:DUF3105 domain-containing protein n=1 Tax=Gorillibacterium sp. sgz5001074 TaxID=3446695 RepID=UPI003F661823